MLRIFSQLLFNLWIEQRLCPRAVLRIGQFSAGQEFMISPTANLFVNSTFGWPASFAADLPSGGPAFPIAAPGLRLSYAPTTRTKLLAAVFPGDPAGHGSDAPQRRDAFGLNSFRLSGRPFVIAEAAWQAPAVSLKLGGWVHFDRFQDTGPVPPGIQPSSHDGNSALYFIVDGALWADKAEPRRVLHSFLRGSVSPSDRNRVDRYLDAGVSLAAPFANRPDPPAERPHDAILRSAAEVNSSATAGLRGGNAGDSQVPDETFAHMRCDTPAEIAGSGTRASSQRPGGRPSSQPGNSAKPRSGWPALVIGAHAHGSGRAGYLRRGSWSPLDRLQPRLG